MSFKGCQHVQEKTVAVMHAIVVGPKKGEYPNLTWENITITLNNTSEV